MRPFLKDPNSLRKRFKILRFYDIAVNKIEKAIEQFEEKINDEKYREERKENIEKLGQIIELYRDCKNHLYWYRRELLDKCNLTG